MARSIVIGAGLFAVAAFLLPSLKLDHYTFDVDINTGRIRSSRYFGPFKVSETIRETALSAILPPEEKAGVTADWWTMSSTPSPSPSYAFMGTLLQIENLERDWNCSAMAVSLRRKTAREILALWQFEHGNSLARYFVYSLDPLCGTAGRPILQTLERLEVTRERVEGNVVTRTYLYADGTPLLRVRGYRDAAGRLVQHGATETWYPDGSRQAYANYRSGKLHGPRFSWQPFGLMAIEVFRNDDLIEMVFEDIEKHPEYATARRLARERATADP